MDGVCSSCGGPLVTGHAFCSRCGAPAAVSASPAAVPAGWYPDPTGRFTHRYWDGASWTPHASRGDGIVWSDPLEGAAPSVTQAAASAESPSAGSTEAPVRVPATRETERARPTGGLGRWSPRRVVALLLAIAATSVASGLLRVAMFGLDEARDSSSMTFLVMNTFVSFLVSFGVFALAARMERRSSSAIRVVAAMLLVAIPWLAGTGVAGAEEEFDWNAPFTGSYYLVHITETSTTSGPVPKDVWILSAEPPDDDGILLTPDGYGGTFSNKTDTSLGPFKTPTQVCQAALGQKLQGASFSAEGRYFGCDDYRKYQKKVVGTTVFGGLGLILFGIGVSAGSVLTGGLGLACGGVAAYIWFKGAPGPIKVRATPLIQRYLDLAKGESVKLERAQLRGLTPEEAADLGVVLEHLSQEQKMRVAKELGIEYQTLAEALRDYKNLPANYF